MSARYVPTLLYASVPAHRPCQPGRAFPGQGEGRRQLRLR